MTTKTQFCAAIASQNKPSLSDGFQSRLRELASYKLYLPTWEKTPAFQTIPVASH